MFKAAGSARCRVRDAVGIGGCDFPERGEQLWCLCRSEPGKGIAVNIYRYVLYPDSTLYEPPGIRRCGGGRAAVFMNSPWESGNRLSLV